MYVVQRHCVDSCLERFWHAGRWNSKPFVDDLMLVAKNDEYVDSNLRHFMK